MISGAVFLFGLLWGSFLNVCIYRIPLSQSVVFPASNCPHCKTPIKWYDNIPLVSYLLLAGRCRHCKDRISLRYPAIELLTALLFLFCYTRADSSSGFNVPEFLSNLIFASLIIPLIFIDYYHYILPNVITIPGSLIGIALSPFQALDRWDDFATNTIINALSLPTNPSFIRPILGSLLGIMLGAGILWLVREIYYWLRKIEGLGFGDIKMMAMVGAFLGWKLAWLTILIGSLTGSIFGLFLILTRGKDLKYALCFGTFLGVGALTSLFYGDKLLSWYKQAF